MVYSPQLKKAIGEMKDSLAHAGLGLQSRLFASHGRHDPAPEAPLVLVACSGGRDSLALAYAARIVCASWGIRCGAAIIDHQLQMGSGQVADQTAEQCRELGLEPVVVKKVQVKDPHGQGVEAAARQTRYQALTDLARHEGSRCLLLAHTFTDQAETVALGLLRHPDLRALAGIPAKTEKDSVLILRPFLKAISRQDTEAICRAAGLAWWDDPANGEASLGPLPGDYPLRSRIRQDFFPALNAFAGSDMVKVWAGATQRNQEDFDYLESQADAAFQACCQPVKQAELAKLADLPELEELTGQTELSEQAKLPELAELPGAGAGAVARLVDYPSYHRALRTRILYRLLERSGSPIKENFILQADAFLVGPRRSGLLPGPGGEGRRLTLVKARRQKAPSDIYAYLSKVSQS